MIDLHRAWLDKAAFLECPRVLLNQGQPTEENKQLLTSNYQAVTGLAKAKGINPASENRGGGGGGRAAGAAGAPAQPGAQPAQAPPATSAAVPAPPPVAGPPSYLLLTEILKASGTATCVDFLNFPDQEIQLAGIRHMLPLNSGLVHAGHALRPACRHEICRELGYKGLYAIKASGLQGDPIENTAEDHRQGAGQYVDIRFLPPLPFGSGCKTPVFERAGPPLAVRT